MEPKDEQPQADGQTPPPNEEPQQTDQAADDATKQPVDATAQTEQPRAEEQPAATDTTDATQQSADQPPVEGPGSSSLEQPATETTQTPQDQPPQSVVNPQSDGQSAQQNMGGFAHVGGKQTMMKKLIKIVAIVVVAIVAIVVVQSLMSGGKIGSLTDDTQDGISFMRPEKWQKAESDDEFTYFTEEGVSIENVDLGLLLGSEAFGVSFDSLSEAEQQTVRDSFESQFASLDTSLTDGSCEKLAGIDSSEIMREGYSLAFSINATCEKLQGKESGGTVKMILGWHDDELHIFGVVADDATWDSDGAKLDEIVASVKPAE